MPTTNKWDQFQTALVAHSTEYGLKVVGALLILAAGWIVAGWLGHTFRRWLEGQQLEPPVRLLMVRLVRLVTLIITLAMVLEQFGVGITTILASMSLVGVGLGLALQGVLSNFVAGLTIIFTKPFRVGEYIEISGTEGLVEAIELSFTTLIKGDLSRVVIPNRNMVNEILHNHGNVRQLNLSVGVGYGSDLREVFTIVRDVLAANSRVLKTPAAGLGIASLGESAITIAVKPWTTVADYGAAQLEIYQAILDRFRERRIEIPLPQREVRLLNQPAEAPIKSVA